MANTGEQVRSTISALAATIRAALDKTALTEWTLEINLGFKGKAGIPFITEAEGNGVVKVTAKHVVEIKSPKTIHLDCVTSELEGETVDLYGANPDTKSRDICQHYTIGTWRPDTNDFLFDHAPRKGFSGGIVVLRGRAVGVIVERHVSGRVSWTCG